MSAEILRRAASLMRQRAKAVESWARRNPESSGWPIGWFSPVFIENAFAEAAFGDADDPDLREGWQADGEHIAPWNPTVALAVADSLDTAGADLWAHGPLCCEDGCMKCDDDLWAPHVRRALTVARAYLGEQS